MEHYLLSKIKNKKLFDFITSITDTDYLILNEIEMQKLLEILEIRHKILYEKIKVVK